MHRHSAPEAHTRSLTSRGVIVAMVSAILAALLPGMFLQPANAAFTEPLFVQSTLEGCKGDSASYLPNSFVCPDADYTTGNLGKGWNELDLVPHRLTTSLGSQTNATTTYNMMIAGDNSEQNSVGGLPEGYDFISQPVVNTAKSHASCTVSSGAQIEGPSLAGGNDDSIYRILTISQNKGTTCVFDWVKRLSITSEDYSGSSLQAYLFQTEDFSGGQKTVPIPVNETLPQELDKTMTATQDSEHVWEITKTASPVSMIFGNTCDVANPLSQPVEITISWEKLDASPSGDITVQTTISATNPAKRALGIEITDVIYGKLGGGAESVLDTEVISGTIAANTSTDFTHTITVPSGTTGLRDVATAEYSDLQFPDVDIDETTTASASATVQSSGNVNNDTAVITDSEDISGNGLTFSVDSVSGSGSTGGSFDNGYTLGTKTSGPVDWTSATQSSSGSVTFTKTVYAAKGTIEPDGELTDTAELNGSDGFGPITATASTDISVDTKAELTIDKSIPNILTGNETQTFSFVVKNSNGQTVATPSITFNAGDTNKSATVSDLPPDTYTVSEDPEAGWQAQPDIDVDLTGTKCSGTASFENTPSPASARVKKVTVPAGFEADWSFDLYKGNTFLETATTTGTGFVNFTSQLGEGTYSIVETEQGGWNSDGGSADCTFTVDLPDDAGSTFSCTYTNTYEPSVTLDKDGDDLSKTSQYGNDTVDYTFTVKNTGDPGDAAGAPDLSCTVSDPLVNFSQTVTLVAGEEKVLEKLNFSIPSSNNTDPNFGTSFKNTASVSCTYPGLQTEVADATSSHVTNLFEPRVELTKTGPAYAKVGDTVTYTILIENTSSADTPDLVFAEFADTLVPNVDPPASCDTLASGDDCTFTYDYVVQAGDYTGPGSLLGNQASVRYNPTGFPNNITDYDPHAVTLIAPSYTITKDCLTNNVPAGAAVTFGVDVTNTGDVPLNIELTDSIPLNAGNTYLAFGSDPATLVFSNGKVSFTLPVGSTVSLEISTIASGSQVVNDVSATATLDASYGMPNYSSTKTARATCDVISGATRTIGFWRTHLEYATHILDEHTLDSAATRNADGTVLDGPLGVTANGTFENGAYITLGWKKLYSVQDVMGILWADTAKQTTGKKRTSLCQARIITSKQLVGAILNSGLDNAQDDGGLIAQAITALAGTNVSAIKSVGSQLDAYNNSGDDVGLIDLDGTTQGPATPQAAKAYANKSVGNC